LEAVGCVRALERALLICRRRPDRFIIPTRAASNCCISTSAVAGAWPGISMTESNHCAENALAERMNGILKQEYGLGLEFGIKADARRAVDQSVWLYNTQRPHTALGYQTPAQVHQVGLN